MDSVLAWQIADEIKRVLMAEALPCWRRYHDAPGARQEGEETKPDGTSATEADRNGELLLMRFLREQWPAVTVIGEETAKSREVWQKILDNAGPGDEVWTLDPIDGTYDLMRGRGFGCMAARVVGQESRQAWIGFPVHETADGGFTEDYETLYAEAGRGLWRLDHGTRCATRVVVPAAPSALERVGLAHYIPSPQNRHQDLLATFDRQAKTWCLATTFRRAITDGSIGILFDGHLTAWDHVPIFLMAREVGFAVSDLAGREIWRVDAGNNGCLIMPNRALQRAFLTRLPSTFTASGVA